MDYFRPIRSAQREGSPGLGAGSLDFPVDSDSKNFLIPEFGYNHLINPDLAVGVTVYGNGGLNTNYPGGQLNCGAGPNTVNALCGSGRLGVDLLQLVIAPTLSYNLNASHSIDIAPLLGYQRFKAEGLQAFDNAPGFPAFTSSPGNVTNRGYDSATGYGVRIGYLGKLADGVTFGAAYASKINMRRFDKYKGLFAEQGDFDIPENYNVGVAFQASTAVMVAVDYQCISYAKVQSVGNPSTNRTPLGVNGGPGFGWRNIDVSKLGIEYTYSPQLTLRAGYNRSQNPIPSRDVSFNIIAPGLVQDHITLGFTSAVGKDSDITVAYMHAFEKSVTGGSFFNNLGFGPVGGQETIRMYQNSLGIAYARKF